MHGDDSPAGRVPCPIYRQSYTSARDFYNLIGTQTYMAPIAAQDDLGVNHQTEEDFTDDAVIAFMRGNAFVPLYLDPLFLNESRWKSLAQLINWAKSNKSIIENTQVLLPASWKENGVPVVTEKTMMPRQVYGYAHCSSNEVLCVLRNPWIEMSQYEMALNESIGLNKTDAQYSISSIYPQERIYKRGAKFGSTVQLQIAPYETVVLSVSKKPVLRKLPDYKSVIGNKIEINTKRAQARKVEYAPAVNKLSDDSIDLAYQCNSAVEINGAAKFNLKSSEGRLLILCEFDSPDWNASLCTVNLDGKNVQVFADGTSTGWRATVQPNPENWTFFWVPLSKGAHDVNIMMLAKNKNVRISGWVWAYTKENGKTSQLPRPEILSLDSAKLFDVIDCNNIGGDAIRKARPVTNINGIYVDTLKNIDGMFKRNLCDNNSIMRIKGIQYTRGLGTTAGTIKIPLEPGKFKRFTATAGVDSAMVANFMDKTKIMFVVKLDGKEVWKSHPMVIRDEPEQVDVSVAAAKMIELETISTEVNGRQCANFADWADAALLK
jgi:hypothetical protein